MITIDHIKDPARRQEITARILGQLPQWFTDKASNDEYVELAAELEFWAALDGDEPVGLAAACRHFTASAELMLLAVAPGRHRGGIGKGLLATVEAWARAEGIGLLQIKTLGPSDPDEGYGRTREFYRAMGFQPLEEFEDLWAPEPCLLMVKVLTGEGTLDLAARSA